MVNNYCDILMMLFFSEFFVLDPQIYKRKSSI